MHGPWTWTKGGLLEGMGVPGRGEQRRRNWDNCNRIINKIYSYKKELCHRVSKSARVSQLVAGPRCSPQESGLTASIALIDVCLTSWVRHSWANPNNHQGRWEARRSRSKCIRYKNASTGYHCGFSKLECRFWNKVYKNYELVGINSNWPTYSKMCFLQHSCNEESLSSSTWQPRGNTCRQIFPGQSHLFHALRCRTGGFQWRICQD